MDEQIKSRFTTYFNKLPKDVQDAFYGLHIDSFVAQHKEMQPLEDWQKFAVENDIIFTFVGLSEPAMLATRIRADAEISRERAENIARIIENEILLPNAHILDQVFDTIGESEPQIPVPDGVARQPSPVNTAVHDTYREPIDDARPPHTNKMQTASRQNGTIRSDSMMRPPAAAQNMKQPGASPIPSIRTMSTDMEQPKNSLDIFGERLAKPVSTPVEQTVLEEKKSAVPSKPQETSVAVPKKETLPAASQAPKGHDPYREPIN